jgi:hypothetical protein
MLFVKLTILWSRGLLEKLAVAQLLAVSNGIRRFIFVLSRSAPPHTNHNHWTPS